MVIWSSYKSFKLFRVSEQLCDEVREIRSLVSLLKVKIVGDAWFLHTRQINEWASVNEWISTWLGQLRGDRVSSLVTLMTGSWTQGFSSLPMSLFSHFSIFHLPFLKRVLSKYTRFNDSESCLLSYIFFFFSKEELCLFPFKSDTEGVLALCPLRADFPAPCSDSDVR